MPLSILENCTIVQKLVHSFPIKSADFSQLTLSIATLISIFYGIYKANQLKKNKPDRNQRIQPYCIQSSLWITLLSTLIFYALLSVMVILLKIYGFYQLLFGSDSCNLLWSPYMCLSIKFPLSAIVCAYNAIVFVLLIERVIATYSNRFYSLYGKFLGFGLIFMVFLITALTLYYLYKDDELSKKPAYCFITMLTSYEKMTNVISVFVFLNFATTFGAVLLFFISRNHMDRRDVDYQLSKSLDLNENYVSNQLVVPLTILHFLLFLIFSVSFLWSRNIVQQMSLSKNIALIEWIYTLNFVYTLIMTNYGFYLRQHLLSKQPEWLQHRATNDATELYFAMFDALIDSNVRR